MLRTLGGAAGLAVADASVLNAATMAADEPWLAAIAAKKRKAIMDVMHFFPDGTPFRRARTLLNVMHENYGAAEGDMGLAVGAHGRGLAHLVSAATWDDLGLAEWLLPQLNGAEAAALKAGAGTFASASAAGVAELRARGVRFLACRETIARWAQRVATQKRETPAAVTERILKGLHDGVEPVPAMGAAVVVAQEQGARYVAVA